MPPQETNNNRGGRLARAASGTVSRCDAARADDLQVLARGCAVIAGAVSILMLNAPELWPQLFLP